MYKTTLIIIISGLLAVSYSSKTIIDINNDGYVDTLEVNKMSDNFVSEYRLSVKNGITGITYNSIRIGNIGNFFSIIPVDIPVTNDSFYHAYCTILKDTLCSGFAQKKTPDESLRWLLDYYEKTEYKHSKKIKQHWFDSLTDFKPYFVIIKRDDYPNLVENIPRHLKNTSQDSALINTLFNDAKEFIIVYYIQNHIYNDRGIQYPQIVSSKKNVNVLKTMHGVLLRKNNNYCWLYISDGVYKLRHASIGTLKYYKNQITFEKNATDDISVIKINTDNDTFFTIKEIVK